jgi:hypothetical protein
MQGTTATGSNIPGANITFDASNGTGSAGSGAFIFRTAAGTVDTVGSFAASTTFDATTTATPTFSYNTLSYTLSAQSNRILLLGVNTNSTVGTRTVASVTYAGVAMTQLATQNGGTGTANNCRTELWYMKESALSGITNAAHTFTIVYNNASGTLNYGANAIELYNVDQTNTFASQATNSGNSTLSSVTVPGTNTNQMVLDFAASAGSIFTPNAAQTQLWMINNNADTGAASKRTGASGGTTMSWSLPTDTWAEIGVAVNPLGGTGADTLTERLRIDQNGNVGIGASNPTATLNVVGTSLFQSGTNSTTAFQIQNSGGTSLLTADTQNMKISVNGQLYANGNVNGTPLSTYASGRFSDSQIQGNYLYGTINATNSLAIFDITNPNNFATSSISVTSIAANCTGVNGIAVAGKYAYISCNTNHVMAIYNVSNPAAPAFVSSISIGASFSTNLVVHGQYVITSSAIAGANGIYIFDVSNPALPKLVKNLGTTNNYGLAVQGNYLYAIDNGNLQIYDITNPSSPVTKGSRALSGAPINGGNFGDKIISVMGRYAYIADTTNSQVGIYDISNPASIPAPTTISTGASSQPWVTAVRGNELYVPTANGNIVTIDITNPTSPVLTQTATVAGNLYTMAISGRYAFVSDRTAGSVYAIDLGGAYIQQLEAGGLQADNVNVNGNTVLGGDVIVQGAAVFNQGISVMGGAAIQSAGTGTIALSVDNTTTGINLMQVKDLNTNFGSAVTAGAFISRNSYFGE